MAVSVICSCGKHQHVAAEMAGRTLTCAGCGKPLNVPRMGVLAAPKAKPAAMNVGKRVEPQILQAKQRPAPVPVPPPERSSSRMTITLFGAALLLLLGAASGVAWWLTRGSPELPNQLARNSQAGPTKTSTPVPLPESPKSATEPVKQPDSVTPIVEPVKPTVDPPKPAADSTKSVDPPKRNDPPQTAERKPPANLIEPLRLMWKLAPGDHFFQELTVTQKPTFKVQGIAVASQLQYQIVSRFTVKDASADGLLVVEQKVVSAKLLFADELTKPAVAGAVAQMPGSTYTLHLNAKMDVTKFEGAVAGPKVGAMNLDGGLGVQMTSLLDRDGWKELAQSTFFQMDEPLQSGARWSKPHAHNWGSMGGWSGKIHYAYAGQQDGYHKIAFGSQLAYKPPATSQLGLLTVQSADFKTPQTGGTLFFDAVKGKVVAAEERFRVTGVLNASLLGQNTPIEIDEDQHFLIRIHEKLQEK
jgi:hypothetical protein